MMGYQVVHEWVAERMDCDGEIADTSAFTNLADAQGWGSFWPGTVYSLRRCKGNDLEGEVDRQVAYPGSTCYDGGAAIPKRLLGQLMQLPEVK